MAPQVPQVPQHLIDLTLQYLLPPSPPLPVHLLSAPLLQRHLFLSIDASSAPEDYFLWPRKDQSRNVDVIHALEDLSSQKIIEGQSREVFYEAESDEDVIKAFVIIPHSPVDIGVVYIFVQPSGDDTSTSEWRYHDIIFKGSSMPSHRDVESALSARPNSKNPDIENQESQDVTSAEDYWDGYGSSPGATPLVHVTPLPLNNQRTGDPEDAYFSQYSQVETAVPSLESPTSLASFEVPDSDLPSIPSEARNTPTLSEYRNGYPPMGLSDQLPLFGQPHTLADPLYRASSSHNATRSSISGLYNLWLLCQPLPVEDKTIRKELFMKLVSDAVDYAESTR